MAVGLLLGTAAKAALGAIGGSGKVASAAKNFLGTDEGKASALGVGQMIAGRIRQKKADSMTPAVEDPEQIMLQRQFSRQKRAFQTGTANAPQTKAIQQMMRSGLKESMKYGAGMRGLNAMNQMYSNAMMGLNQQGADQAREYAGMEGSVLNQMAQRRLEIGMEKYDREQARAAQQITDGRRNLGASLTRMTGKGVSTDGAVK